MRTVTAAIFALLLLPSLAGAQQHWPGERWAVVEPAAAGMDGDRLEAALRFAADHDSRGVVVVRGGRIVAERYWKGWDAQTMRDMFSAQKSVTSTLVGIAQAQGLLPDLDASVATWFPEWKGTPKARITVRHLLSMTSGLEASRKVLLQHMLARDKTAYTLRLPQVHPPGQRWEYGNPAYALLIELVTRATKQGRQAFASKTLLEPLGMKRTRLGLTQVNQRGRWKLTHEGCEISCRDMARFGLLALRGGRWRERQVVPAAYLARATRHNGSTNPAYGYLWWLNSGSSHIRPMGRLRKGRMWPSCPTDAYAALGARDSKIYVVPSLDLVVTRLGEDAKREGALAGSTFDDGFLSRVCKAVRAGTD